jgi:acetylornithine deacetylase/succinyl-diaminopimelate desuccinylase-like protein
MASLDQTKGDLRSLSITTWTFNLRLRRLSPGYGTVCDDAKGDTYYGRGTTDDKGPALAALFGARAALEAAVPVNIHFLWELEEEIGSPNFEQIISRAAKALKTDSVVV